MAVGRASFQFPAAAKLPAPHYAYGTCQRA